MTEDRAELAQLWLSELGAYVPEAHHGEADRPRLQRFGLDRSPRRRAQLHGHALGTEQARAREYRARSDPSRRPA